MYIFCLTFATNSDRAVRCIAKVLTQTAKIQGPRRWCLPSSRGPWRCLSEARFRRPSPSPQTHRDGWAFRSPGGSQGRWSHVVRCWSRGSGCNTWAQRWSPSHSLWPELVRGGIIASQSIYSLLKRSQEVMNMLASVHTVIFFRSW